MAFCIPKTYAAALKNAFNSGDLSAEKLYNMTSDERKTAIASYIPDKSISDEVHSRFETEMVDRQKKGITNWIDKQTEGADAAKKAADSVSNIGVVKPGDLSKVLKGVVEARHGVALSDEQLKLLNTKVDAYDEAINNSGGRKNKDIFVAKKDLQDTINSFKDPNLKKKVSQIGMANILSSPASIEKSWVGGKVYEVLGKIGRRIRSGQLDGLSTEMASQDASEALKTYKETGINPAMTIGGDILSGESRKTGNTYVDTVLQKLHGTPHARTYIESYYDEANMSSTRLAYADVGKGSTVDQVQEKAQSIYKDATSLNPQTDEGKIVHAQASTNAAYWSNLNDSKTAQFTEKLRGAIESLPGGKNLGRLIMPMVKVGANIAEKNVDFAGGSIIKSFTDTEGMKTALEATNQVLSGAKSPEEYDQILNGSKWKKAVLAAAGSGSAYLMGSMLVSAIGANNYQGVPTTAAEYQEMNERGAKANSVRIGGRWYSLSLLPGIGALMAGEFSAMQSRGQGNSILGSLGTGAESVLTSLANEVPGFSNATTYAEDLVGGYGVGGKLSNAASDIVSDIYGRVVPSIIGQAGKAADPYQRQTPSGVFGYTETQIPGLRNNLPIKVNETGQPLTQNPLATFLSGSYTSTDINTPVTSELDRIVKKGVPLTIEEPQNNADFKILLSEQGQDTYNKATSAYYTQLNDQLTQLFAGDEYKSLPLSSSDSSVLTKKKLISNTASQVRKEVLGNYGYTKQTQSDATTIADTP